MLCLSLLNITLYGAQTPFPLLFTENNAENAETFKLNLLPEEEDLEKELQDILDGPEVSGMLTPKQKTPLPIIDRPSISLNFRSANELSSYYSPTPESSKRSQASQENSPKRSSKAPILTQQLALTSALSLLKASDTPILTDRSSSILDAQRCSSTEDKENECSSEFLALNNNCSSLAHPKNPCPLEDLAQPKNPCPLEDLAQPENRCSLEDDQSYLVLNTPYQETECTISERKSFSSKKRPCSTSNKNRENKKDKNTEYAQKELAQVEEQCNKIYC